MITIATDWKVHIFLYKSLLPIDIYIEIRPTDNPLLKVNIL